jgi:uncharacterized membrane protein YuzA (DUF378 family)
MKVLTVIAQILVIIGGLNWGLVGLANFNAVTALLGGTQPTDISPLSRVIYVLVGLSAVVAVFSMKRLGKGPESKMA